MAKYRKTLAAAVGAALTWGRMVVASAPAHITADEWITGGFLLATAFGVYAVRNTR